MKKVGLYFGTFNPIHNGHLALGNYFIKNTDIDEVRFIVSPQNPFKEKKETSVLINNLGQKTLADTMQKINDYLLNEIK